ncbi:hypothetical protein [Caniella muris]|uniref:hypothetical protein n=1 Tax=Caniella muris TaxID=2941502 RepID=UPI00203B66D5|nr:hypothetical protein [Caniella muris]
MLVVIEGETFVETYDVLDGRGVRLEAVPIDEYVVGVRIVASDGGGERVVGVCPLAHGRAEEAESLDAVISMAVEDPEMGGCGLRSISVGTVSLFDRGDALHVCA